MQKGHVHAISISPERGQLKKEVPQARLIENFGIENDGHAGDWGRQITCLCLESVTKACAEHNIQVGPGGFAENILLADLDWSVMKIGTRIRLGETAVLEVTQIGKEDHPSVVSRALGFSLLPHEGLFCQVITGGMITKGDIAEILHTGPQEH